MVLLPGCLRAIRDRVVGEGNRYISRPGRVAGRVVPVSGPTDAYVQPVGGRSRLHHRENPARDDVVLPAGRFPEWAGGRKLPEGKNMPSATNAYRCGSAGIDFMFAANHPTN